MNKRIYSILKYILQEKGRATIKDISNFTGVNDRTVRYDIEKINELLLENGIALIEKLSKGELYHKEYKDLNSFIQENFKTVFISEYRQTIILIKVLFSNEICISDLCKEFDVTRTTIKNELSEIRTVIRENGLELETTGSGLKLVGSEESVRNSQLKLLNKYRNLGYTNSSEKMFLFTLISEYLNNLSVEEIEKFINYIAKQLNIIITDETYFILSNYILIMISRIKEKKNIESISNKNFYSETNEFKILKKGISFLEANFMIEISDFELVKLTDYFLGCSNLSLNNSAYKEWLEIEIIVKKIILHFKKIYGVDLSGDTSLVNGLVNHIKPTIHRIKNGIKLENSVYDEVLENYPELLEDVREALKILEEFIGIGITDDEIAFIALHFKGAIDRNKVIKKESKNVILICGYGYGTSKLLEQQLKERYNINILEVVPLNQLSNIILSDNIDLIITTLIKLELNTEIPIVSVHPILKKEDIEILDGYNLPKHSNRILLSTLIKSVSSNCEIRDRAKLIEEFKTILEGKVIDDLSVEGKKLSDFLNVDNIKLKLSATTWEEAIKKSGKILLECGNIEEEYIETMVDKIKQYGSYIVITDLLAIPHGDISVGVKNSGMALVTLDRAVLFPENRKVKYLLAFCTTESKDYLDALNSFLELVDNHKFLDILNSTNSVKKVIDTIKKYEFLSKMLSH
ncbi:BglG family transcription antiterminator [Fusobacterium sp.]|uniref:BglG family transcription antiterminator n=1 Tax=Fusobacterium sp. TaxID=68766 RepID=UPI0025B80ED7|nr:BglG family transcription antiterminator [Fusobacterium sp.]